MKTTRIASVLLLGSLAFASAHADGLRFLPALESGFKAEPTLALTAGVMNTPAARDNAIGVYGIDFNMNCGLIQTPENRIRTHIQFNHVNQSGVKATTIELSPRYTLPLGGGFSFGAGPSLAYVSADTLAGDKNLFGYGAAAGFNFRKGMYYSGLEARYLNTNERNNVQFENWTFGLKIGVNF